MRLIPFLVFLVSLTTAQSPAEPITGMVGVGTWKTQAEFKDIKVTKNGRTLFSSERSKDIGPWKTHRGEWRMEDGVLTQGGDAEDARALIGDPSWSDCTITLKARKTGGNEGFLILFGVPSADSHIKSWWNVGGWDNSGHAIQSPGVPEQRVPGHIEQGRWYDLKIELDGGTVRTYLDGKMVQTASKPSDKDAQREFPHALIPDLFADPAITEFDGTFYCYGTTDGMGQGLATSGLPVVWKSKDFLHWSFDGSIMPPNFDAKFWAPGAVVERDGRYYLFATLDNHITALVSGSPDGPFRTLDGKDITKTSGWEKFPIHVGHPIDAEVFRDDDGSYYMVWSQRFIAKMNDDFSGFDGEPVEIRTKRGGYSEGPQIIQRDGIYYYLYTLGGSESYQYAYMMSRESIMGPWEAPEHDIISTTDRKQGIYGPGHGCFFRPDDSDQWYFIHLEYGRSGTNRQPVATKMNFNADGTIQPIVLSAKGVGALRKDSRYSTPNLALGKRAIVSSTLPENRIPPIADPTLNRIETFAAANALDGSNGSRWMATESDPNPRFQVDLGSVREIRRTELFFVQPTSGHAYRLESSVDGKTWQTYGGNAEVGIRSPHVDETPAKARYLRLTILKGVAGLWEFGVY
ncbi:MAG: family 43 glycosylhydrolase [Akkermansiaceae bacterium]|nr:family 43 glycosylhydrolase [Akkermansiaceae bacterium]MCP5543140.1 family 43 glycosylhydrolase [Akkermansiaceae bacterium]MCP5547391.1 family 43 glycosylhydrolase [Akkermansiaceae bacterium]